MPPARPTDAKAFCAEILEQALATALPGAPYPALTLERPKDPKHGDYACNVAMQLARALKKNPREIAQAIIAALPPSPYLDKADVAGAGFINLYLKRDFKQLVVKEALTSGAAFGTHAAGSGKRVQVEFVSANPTGPLHVGHGRGAAFG